MKTPRRFGVWAAGAWLATLAVPGWAAEVSADGRSLPPVVELGVGGVPATSPSREALADLLQQLESLQTELRRLRGQVELQNNEIERLKARQRDLLADIDRRVSELERRPSVVSGSETVPTAEITTSSVAGGVASAAQEQQAYEAAFNLMKQGHYDRATKGFRDFLTQYPQSALRDNAQYWLGEAYYVVRDFRKALTEFTRLMNEYPKSLKAPDALLKIGYSHYELGDRAKARDALNQVIARYPGQPAAKSAEQRLAKMKKEGR
ncbi:MAG TPA: tol-pal system protein YbgF [Sulfuricaulis sp.]|nr:tol-pal system protein YbgF [Sulfuricaulis sp.]